MLLGSKTSNFDSQSQTIVKRFVRATALLLIASALLTIGIVATSVQTGETVSGQSTPQGCENPPVEPRNVELWKHDRGILVQWDACPDHQYDIRWRDASQTLVNPFNWPQEVENLRTSEHDITGLKNANDGNKYTTPLTNGRQYIVQLRATYFYDNRFDTGSWSDDYLVTPRRCSDLPETPTDVRVLPGDSNLTVSWNRCNDSDSQIRWRKVGNADWTSTIEVGNVSTYAIRNLENGTQYDVQVRSASPDSSRYNESNDAPFTTDWTTPVKASPTSVCPPGVLVVPKEFVVVPGNAELFVTWRPCPNHKYQLAYRQRPDSTPGWPSENDWINVGFDGHRIRNLSNVSPYEVRIRSRLEGTNTSSNATGGYVATPKRPVVNNRAPRWEDVPRSINLVENRNYDNPIATIEATDPDGRDDAIRYEIVTPFPAPEIFPFTINARDGEIYLYDKLDYEVIDRYQFKVRAVDVSGAEIESEIRIEVIDAEGPPPPVLNRVCSTNSGVNVDWNSDYSKYTYQLQHRLGSADANRPVWITTRFDTGSSDTDFDLTNNTEWVFRVRAVDKVTGEQSKWSSEEGVFVGGVDNRAPEFRRGSIRV